jgi:hypothetical protein
MKRNGEREVLSNGELGLCLNDGLLFAVACDSFSTPTSRKELEGKRSVLGFNNSTKLGICQKAGKLRSSGMYFKSNQSI